LSKSFIILVIVLTRYLLTFHLLIGEKMNKKLQSGRPQHPNNQQARGGQRPANQQSFQHNNSNEISHSNYWKNVFRNMNILTKKDTFFWSFGIMFIMTLLILLSQINMNYRLFVISKKLHNLTNQVGLIYQNLDAQIKGDKDLIKIIPNPSSNNIDDIKIEDLQGDINLNDLIEQSKSKGDNLLDKGNSTDNQIEQIAKELYLMKEDLANISIVKSDKKYKGYPVWQVKDKDFEKWLMWLPFNSENKEIEYYIFSDITCPACQNLEKELLAQTDENYAIIPVGILSKDSLVEATVAACSKTPKINWAKRILGEEIPVLSKDNEQEILQCVENIAINTQYFLVNKFNETPTIVQLIK